MGLRLLAALARTLSLLMPSHTFLSNCVFRIGLGAGVLLLGGCEVFGPVDCDTGIYPAVTVAVVDAATGLPIAEGASGYAQDGNYRASLRVVRGDSQNRATHLGAADARPGTYTVVVQRPGYAPWSVSNLQTGGRCHAVAPEQRAALTAVP